MMGGPLPLYGDDMITVSLSDKPVSTGHMIVSPADTKITSLEQLDDKKCDMLFYGASYGATAIFEFLKAQGSNIILTEDDSTLEIDVIARNENDGLELMWQGSQADPNELKETSKSIKDAIDYEVWAHENPEEAAKADKPVEQKPAQELSADDAEVEDEKGDKKVNYLLRSLRRVP
ncbi:MAG: hypothetical protein ACOCZV_01285 [Nanoarchaeota archaeon]